MTALIYPILGHWVWGGGWLAGLGFWDFAGSTVVHAVELKPGGGAKLGRSAGSQIQLLAKEGKSNALEASYAKLYSPPVILESVVAALDMLRKPLHEHLTRDDAVAEIPLKEYDAGHEGPGKAQGVALGDLQQGRIRRRPHARRCPSPS